MIPLGEVLRPSSQVFEVSPTQTYSMAGMLNRGRGLFAKVQVTGLETSYKKLTRLEVGQLVYSRLFAWEGAITVVSGEFEGFFVSPEFPVFDLDSSRVHSAFLAHVTRWPAFHEKVADSRQGLGLRRQRVSPEALLRVRVPLPEISVQQRVAGQLDQVVRAAAAIASLRSRTSTRAEALIAALATQPHLAESAKRKLGWRRLPLGKVMQESNEVVTVQLDKKYLNLGIYSFGRGVFEKPPIDGVETSASQLRCVRSGQFIYSRLFAFEGAYAFVPERFDGRFVSNEFPSFDVDPELATAEFIAAALRNPSQWSELAGFSKGLGLRRQRIKVEALLSHELWFPPIGEQRRIVTGLQKLDRIRQLAGSSEAASVSVIPAALDQAFAELT